MATSGTTTFEKGFNISDIIAESYERIGMTGVTGYQLRGARTSLNILFQEWANRGLHYWEIKNNNLTLVNGQSVYTMYRSTDDGTSDATAVYGVDDVLEASKLIQGVDLDWMKNNPKESTSLKKTKISNPGDKNK